MKVRVTLKDPDALFDSVVEALMKQPKPDGVSREEWMDIRTRRTDEIKAAISRRWMQYGEYLDVEFVVNDDGVAETATVVALK